MGRRGFRVDKGILEQDYGRNRGNPLYKYGVGIIKRILAENPNKLFSTDGMLNAIRLKVLEDIKMIGPGNYNPKNATPLHRSMLRESMTILTWAAGKTNPQIVKRFLPEGQEYYYWGSSDIIISETGNSIEDAKNLEEMIESALDEHFPGWESDCEIIEKGIREEGEDEEPLPLPDGLKWKEKWIESPTPKWEKESPKPVDHGPEIIDLKKRVNRLEEDKAELLEKVNKLDKLRKLEFTIVTDDKKEIIKGTVHHVFPEVLFHIRQNDNVLLVGPKGCGKTMLAGNIAKHLKRRFGMLSLSGGITEGKLIGRSVHNLTNGRLEYHGTKFVDFCENGGVFLLDEVDGGDSNVLLTAQSTLANRQLELDRPKDSLIEVHEKFVCIAAANTYGTGADRQYCGRNQLDGAFLDRFVFIEMDYDKDLEFKLCPGQEEWVEKIHRYRERINENRLERAISTRAVVRAYNWLKNGKDEDYCDSKFFAGWRSDEVLKVKR